MNTLTLGTFNKPLAKVNSSKISFRNNNFINILSGSTRIHSYSVPAERREPKYLEVDKKFQARVQDYVNQGVITSDTLVLDDTGHGVGNLLQTLRNPALNAQGTVYIPEQIGKQSQRRITCQLTEFGDEIQTLQEKSKTSDLNGAAFIGVEIHRQGYYDIDPAKLPSYEDLANNGIKKVVVLDEVYPPAKLPGICYVAEDLQDYLTGLESKGLDVDCRGIDPRKEGTPKSLIAWMPGTREKSLLQGENNRVKH